MENNVITGGASPRANTSTNSSQIVFRSLRPDEVDVRPSQIKETGGQTKVDLLLYQDARCGQNILDESVGTLNWQKKYEYVGSLLFCLIGIRNPETGEWIWKSDVGSESNVEKEKGLASDCFKRACVSWGIGRELYSTPKISIPCTDSVIIDPDVTIGADTVILPGTIIKEGCEIGEDCVIGPNSYLQATTVGNGSTLNSVQSENAEVGDGVSIGPFVHLRPNTRLADGVHGGNFVEVKNSTVDEGTKLPHLLYVGDSDVGKNVNFGCGCVTVNYDGRNKARCTIKDGAFLGCNTNLVAPVTVGENAFTAAGSTITEDVPDNALALARSRQTVKEEWVTVKKPYKRQHTEK